MVTVLYFQRAHDVNIFVIILQTGGVCTVVARGRLSFVQWQWCP